MKFQRGSSQLRSLIPAAATTVFGLTLLMGLAGNRVTSTRAQGRRQETISALRRNRRLTNTVPRHLPLSVEVRNLNNESWVRDLEVEITNTSDKPIYYLELFLMIPEIKSSDGQASGFPLHYGRIQLVNYKTAVSPRDLPINPGGHYIFRIPELTARGWDILTTAQREPEPKEVQLVFLELNFGDGTGFDRPDGLPVPRPRRLFPRLRLGTLSA